MLYKNLSDTELAHVMRMRRFLDYLAAFETLVLNRNWGDFKAIFKARRSFKALYHLAILRQGQETLLAVVDNNRTYLKIKIYEEKTNDDGAGFADGSVSPGAG